MYEPIIYVADRLGGSVSAHAYVHISGPLVCHLLPAQVQVNDWAS